MLAPARFVSLILTIASLSSPVFAAKAEPARCAEPNFGEELQPIIQACTNNLENFKLTNDERARLMQVRGRAYELAENLDAAARDYDSALLVLPDDIDLRVNRGWLASSQQDFAEVETQLKAAFQLDPNNARAYDLMGSMAGNAGNFQLEKKLHDKALELRPNFYLTMFHRFEMWKNIGAQREALQALDEFLKLTSPELDTRSAKLFGKRVSLRTMARLQRATMLDAMARHEDAENTFNEFVSIEPGFVSYGWRAWHHFDQDHFDLAIADIEKALSYEQNYWILHHIKGRTLLYMKKYDDAVAALTTAVGQNPKDGSSYWARALALRELRRREDASKDALTAVSVDRGFLNQRVGTLTKLGYLQADSGKNGATPAVRDAVQACMMDEKCW